MPPDAAGLLAAVAAARGGDDAALRCWEHDAHPILTRTLRRAGFDPASADDAVMHLLEEADRVVRTDHKVLREAAWMSAVVLTARARRRRADQRHSEARRRLAAWAPRTCEPPRGAESFEELAVAAARLPPRFALAIRLRLRGLDASATRLALSIELEVGAEQARKIDRRSLALLREALSRSGRHA